MSDTYRGSASFNGLYEGSAIFLESSPASDSSGEYGCPAGNFLFYAYANFNQPHLNCCLASMNVKHLCLIYIIILELLKPDNICVLDLMKYDSLIPCSASHLLIIWLHMKLHPLPNPSIIATLVRSFHRCLEIQIDLSNQKKSDIPGSRGKEELLLLQSSVTSLHLACLTFTLGLLFCEL